mmetsp:Transcript_11781/g.37347  ORF Transcript_11781/g.37347 Transcript_11781/m.37347 type:complete len:189 (-) Transcript_11781:922-1488(-)
MPDLGLLSACAHHPPHSHMRPVPLARRDSPILKVFYNSSTTFEDPAGMAQETFLSDESLTPNPNQDFSQVDPAKLYEEYNRVKAAIAVPAANWMKSGNNDVPFSNFCNDRPLAYIFHIFKESAKLGPDGRFTEIIPGWFTRELPAQFQASGGLAPEIGATASGARRSRSRQFRARAHPKLEIARVARV